MCELVRQEIPPQVADMEREGREELLDILSPEMLEEFM